MCGSCYLRIMQRASRLKRELNLLATEPPPGITCWQDKDQMDDLRARKYRIMPLMSHDPPEGCAEFQTFVYSSKAGNSLEVTVPCHLPALVCLHYKRLA